MQDVEGVVCVCLGQLPQRKHTAEACPTQLPASAAREDTTAPFQRLFKSNNLTIP